MSERYCHKGDPCIFCGIPHDDVGVGPCHGCIVPDGRKPCPYFDPTVEPWGGNWSCKIPDDVEIPECDGLTCTIPADERAKP